MLDHDPTTTANPYTDVFYQGLVGYARHFNTLVHTPDGPGILRNFHYAEELREITGLVVEMPPAEEVCPNLVTYNFAQVKLPDIGSIVKHTIDKALADLKGGNHA